MKPFKELHSEEVNEIISNPPNWIAFWGNSMFVVMLILFLCCSYFIKFPDIVPVSFSLTGKNTPTKLLSRSEGRLKRLMVRNGDRVRAGQNLVFIEGNSNPTQVKKLIAELQKINEKVSNGNWAAVEELDTRDFTELGDLQTEFQSFNLSLVNLKEIFGQGAIIQRRRLLLNDVEDMDSLNKVLNEQRTLRQSEYDLAFNEFEMQRRLYNEKVISQLDFNREKTKVVLKQMSIKEASSLLIQNRIVRTNKEKELIDLDNSILINRENFMQELRKMHNSLLMWKKKYLVEAPLSGTISFTTPLVEQDFVINEQELFRILPHNISFQGLIRIPQYNIGKLALGQKVLVKLDGYPFREYGLLEGKLEQYSLTPGAEEIYWGYVSLPDSLVTNYGKQIPYRNGLKGTAEIVTENRTLATRLISAIKLGTF